MKTVQGKFAEVRVYLWHCAAVLRPGMDVPVFALPAVFKGDLRRMTDDDLKLIVDEGRRQLDRQQGDLERIRSRGATLVTVGLAEIALLSSGAHRAFADGTWEAVLWSAAAVLVLLGLAGAAAVLTARAVLGRTDAAMLAALRSPVLRPVAVAYAQQVSYGEETVRTRLTVLRDAVLLLVLGALVYAALWPVTR